MQLGRQFEVDAQTMRRTITRQRVSIRPDGRPRRPWLGQFPQQHLRATAGQETSTPLVRHGPDPQLVREGPDHWRDRRALCRGAWHVGVEGHDQLDH